MTALGLAVWNWQCSNDGGQPQWTGVGLRQSIRHNRAGQLPARAALPSQAPPRRLQLEMRSRQGRSACTKAKQLTNYGLRATTARTVSSQPVASTASGSAGRARPGPGHADTQVVDSDNLVEQTSHEPPHSLRQQSLRRGRRRSHDGCRALGATRIAQPLPSGPRLLLARMVGSSA